MTATASRGARPARAPQAWAWLAALVAIGLSAVVLLPAVHVEFHDDDFGHLYEIQNLGALWFLLKMHGGHLLVTCNAFFLLFHTLFGPNPAPYMWSAYLTHLFNVGLLFVVARRLSGSVAAACAAAVLWGSSPNNAGTVAWYSVYGQEISVGLLLWVLWRLLQVAEQRPLGRSAPLRWALLVCAAAASFGTGLAMALAMPGVAWLLLPPGPARRRVVTTFAVAMLVLLANYFELDRLNVARFGGFPMSTLAIGSIDSWLQRLSVLYHLLGVGIPSLLLGAFFASTQYPGPLAWTCMAVFAAALVAALCLAPGVLRRRIFAALLLALAAYGMIAAGRSLFLANSGVGLVVQPIRYHYAAPLALALTLAVVLRVLGEHAARWRSAGAILLGVCGGVVGLANVIDAPPIDLFVNSQRQVQATLAAIGSRIAAAPPGGPIYIPNDRFLLYAMPGVELRFHGTAALYAIYIPDDLVDGRPIFFVESDPKIFAATRTGRRSATLVVAPESVPGAPAP